MELCHAILNNDVFTLQEVLADQPDVDVNQAVIGSLTGLHVAAEQGFLSAMQVLVSAGANVNCQDEHGLTPLMTAITAGQPMVALKLLRLSSHVNGLSLNGNTALHLASKQGSVGIIQLLLKAHGIPTFWNSAGESPLSIAIKNLSTPVVQALLMGNTHMDPNTFSPDIRCPNPLYYSLQRQKYILAHTLILSGYRGSYELKQYMTNQQFPLPIFVNGQMDFPEEHHRNHGTDATQNYSYRDLSTTDGTSQLQRIERNLLGLPEAEKRIFSDLVWGSVLPLSLQQVCRVAIRKYLHCDIAGKVSCLPLPETMKKYLKFRTLYTAPLLDTDYQAYQYFNDNAREIY